MLDLENEFVRACIKITLFKWFEVCYTNVFIEALLEKHKNKITISFCVCFLESLKLNRHFCPIILLCLVSMAPQEYVSVIFILPGDEFLLFTSKK